VVTRVLLPLPACHKGVYARLRRAMERVGVRGPLHEDGLAEGEGAGEKRRSDRANKFKQCLNLCAGLADYLFRWSPLNPYFSLRRRD